MILLGNKSTNQYPSVYAKNFNKILQTEFSSIFKRSFTMIEWDISLGWKDGSTYVNQSV